MTDHAEFLGVAQLLTDPNHPLYQKPVAAKFRSKDPKEGQEAYLELGGAMVGQRKPDPDLVDPKVVAPVWKRVQEFAEQHNAPGKFTTFIAFEWSSTPNNSNLHRNVIFGGTVVPELPFDAMQSMRPEDLWAYLERARAAGSDVIAIPHNANISNGLMFQTKDSDGKAFTREYAQRRLDMEPLQEIIQLKGASETAPSLARNDEFADFELYQFELGTGKKLPENRTSFIREAYKSGLALGATLGVNPFKFGLVAASDSHGGTAAPEENNYSGAHGSMDKDAKSRLTLKDPLADKTKFSAAGLTGVWAEENTRESIFAALKRKETYGTSGTFIRARLFGGWNYAADLTASPIGSRKPMRMASRWAAICRRSRAGPRCRHSSWRLPRIRVPAIWIASRSSRAGSMPRDSRRKRSMTSPCPITARSIPIPARRHRSEVRWTSRRRAIPTTSATRSSWRSGRIVSSTLPCRPSTTRA